MTRRGIVCCERDGVRFVLSGREILLYARVDSTDPPLWQLLHHSLTIDCDIHEHIDKADVQDLVDDWIADGGLARLPRRTASATTRLS